MFATISGCVQLGTGGGLVRGEETRIGAMNAVCVYVSAAQLVLQSADQTDGANNCLGEQRILDLTRLFGQLRQLLSCAVCARLLNDPYAPLNNARCQHNVCRLCVRGRKALRPLCVSCKDLQDFKTYVENKTMRCLLLCYKSLCEHLLGSNFYAQLSRQKAHQALTCSGENVFGVAPMPHMTTCGDIIQEGARYEDILNVFALDLPQSTPVIGKVQQQQQQPLATHSVATAATVVNSLVSCTNTTQSVTPTPSLSVSGATSFATFSAPVKRVHTPTVPRLVTPPNPPTSGVVNNITTLLTTPPPPPPHGTIIKLEPSNTHLTAGPSNTHLVMTSKISSLQPQQQQTQFVYVKNLKCAVSEPQTLPQQQQQPSQFNSAQSNTLSSTNNNGLATLASGNTITYVGPNTPGIVVPIVSSSVTTTAPLTIASAKLQSLKRQLAQAQARGCAPISIASAVKAAGLAYTETNMPNNLKSSATGSASLSATIGTSSNSFTISAATSTPLLVNSSNITYVSQSTMATSSPNSTTTSNATTTSQQQQIRNPPSIKTVSNGSAMYSVLYTGVGNKITIKRKTDGDDESGHRKSIATSTAASSSPTAPSTPTATTSNPITVTNPQQLQQQVSAHKMNAAKRRGCRCGNATPTPGKLTCCGQRCPCYVDSKSCIGCKCRGCRNPHRPDGGKVRPVIPELACYEIQMADENPSLSPSDLQQVANTLTTRTHTMSASTTTSPQQLSAQQQGTTLVSEQHGNTSVTSLSLSSLSSSSSSSSSLPTLSSQIHLPSSSSSSPSSKGATLIPFISLHPITSQQNQQQQTQTITSISSNQQQQQNSMLPLESVLIQNAEGKYQVVNVLTTTTPHHQQHNNSSNSIQRLHSIPQLQISSSTNNNSSGSSNSSNNNHTSLVGNMTTVNIITGTTASNAASSSTIVTSKGAGQSILLTQQQQQNVNRLQQQLQQKTYQQQQIQRLISSNIITTSVNPNTTTTSVVSSSSIPIQLQQQQQHRQHHTHPHTQNQQLKSNQIITMRSTTMQNSSNNNTSTHQTQTFTPTLFTSNASNSTTITLSPIIMSSSSPNTFKTELFSDSSESEFMNLANSAGAITSASSSSSNNNNTSIHTNMLSTIYSHSGLVSTPNTPARITSVPSLSSGSTGSASGSTSRMSLGGMSLSLASAGTHLTPALVEVIEASDL